MGKIEHSYTMVIIFVLDIGECVEFYQIYSMKKQHSGQTEYHDTDGLVLFLRNAE